MLFLAAIIAGGCASHVWALNSTCDVDGYSATDESTSYTKKWIDTGVIQRVQQEMDVGDEYKAKLTNNTSHDRVSPLELTSKLNAENTWNGQKNGKG